MYCGAAIAGGAKPPKQTATKAAAIAMVTAENRGQRARPLSPDDVLARHVVFALAGLVVFAAITFWQPTDTFARLVVVMGGPIAYAVVLVLHYGLVRDHEGALITACERSEARFWLVTGICFVVAAAGVLVVLTHLGLIRPSYRRPTAMWNTLVVLAAAGGAAIYFVWFGIRLLRARRG